VDALLADFAETFFGPACAPMAKCVTLMDTALKDSPCCTGSAWDMPHHYSLALRKQARILLDDAAKRAVGKGAFEQRVKVIADSFEMLEAFIGMLDARTKCDFVTAQKELDRLDAVANRRMEMKPVPMLSAGRFSTYVNYMKRFFRPATAAGSTRGINARPPEPEANAHGGSQCDPPERP